MLKRKNLSEQAKSDTSELPLLFGIVVGFLTGCLLLIVVRFFLSIHNSQYWDITLPGLCMSLGIACGVFMQILKKNRMKSRSDLKSNFFR